MVKASTILVLLATSFGLTAAVATGPQDCETDESRAETIFEDRIMPIFRSTDPSSCVQCHLSSVDLKNYILPSHEKTFVSLRDQGMIDLENPEKSKILTFIRMGDRDPDPGTKLIHQAMRKSEYEAFATWIRKCCEDDRLCGLPALEESEQAKPAHPDEVIRHARKSRVVDSFVRRVWSQRMRCFPCHTPHEIGPRQENARKKFDKWQDQYGDQMLIFKETPEATIQYLVEESKNTSDGMIPLLNLNDPANSLLVLKPTSKIPPKIDGQRRPTYAKPVYHMGGLKMHADDHSYKSFIAWITDYAAVTEGRYRTVEDLPHDNWYPTKRVLRMRDVPESLAVNLPMQLFVHARTTDDTGWTKQPVAFTQGTVTPKRIVNGPLILLAPTDPLELKRWRQRKIRLAKGQYLVKVFADTDGKLKTDPTVLLGDGDFQGQIEIAAAQWRVGFPKAEWISAKNLNGSVMAEND